MGSALVPPPTKIETNKRMKLNSLNCSVLQAKNVAFSHMRATPPQELKPGSQNSRIAPAHSRIPTAAAAASRASS